MSNLNKETSILVLGSRGMVGSSIVRELQRDDYKNILQPTRRDLDLLNQNSVDQYFAKKKPNVVILAAAKVGGIHANNEYRADFIFQNLSIQNNVFKACFENNVDKFLFLGSSCIYPKNCPQPIKEEYLLTGPLEETNEPYAIAKIAGLKTAESFNRQYGKSYFSVMPTNLYGENDNFHPENSHVIPALIQRMHSAVTNNEEVFTAWGTGTPMREFLHVDDLAKACIFLLKTNKKLPYWINVGTSQDVTISELVDTIANIMNFQGNIQFDRSKPDGTPRKLLDTTLINSMGWSPTISLRDGLSRVIEYYQKSDNLRSY